MSNLPGVHGQWISTALLLPTLNDADGDKEVLVADTYDLSVEDSEFVHYKEAKSHRYWRPWSSYDKRRYPEPVELGDVIDNETPEQSNNESGYEEIMILLVRRCQSEGGPCSWEAYGGSGLTQHKILEAIPHIHDQGATRLDYRWLKIKVPSDSFSSSPVFTL